MPRGHDHERQEVERLSIKTDRLKALMTAVGGFSEHMSPQRIQAFQNVNSRVANRITTFAGKKLTTVLYAMGGADVAGVIDLLPDAGGTVWSIGSRDLLEDKALADRSSKRILTSKQFGEDVKGISETLLEGGYYPTTLDYLPRNFGPLQVAAGLVAAGIQPGQARFLREYEVGDVEKIKVTSLGIKRGNKTFTFNVVSGVEFPNFQPLIGGTLRPLFDAMGGENLLDNDSVIALSKASHDNGVWALNNILKQFRKPFYFAVNSRLHPKEPIVDQSFEADKILDLWGPAKTTYIPYPPEEERESFAALPGWGQNELNLSHFQITIGKCDPLW